MALLHSVVLGNSNKVPKKRYSTTWTETPVEGHKDKLSGKRRFSRLVFLQNSSGWTPILQYVCTYATNPFLVFL